MVKNPFSPFKTFEQELDEEYREEYPINYHETDFADYVTIMIHGRPLMHEDCSLCWCGPTTGYFEDQTPYFIHQRAN